MEYLNYSFAERKAKFANNLNNMSVNHQLIGQDSLSPMSPSGVVGEKEVLTLSNLASVAEYNSFKKVTGEMIKSSKKNLNSHLNDSSEGVMDELNQDTISINKNILPFFSVPVILKKISDQKQNNNLNLLNPQKKLVYKIIKLNTKLVEFTTKIKKYNFNLNSFKGNNLDFILFIKNNLYYNLKYRLNNILYKIEKFLPVLKFYSLLYNINLFSPKRLLKPQPYIRFSYRLRHMSKVTIPSDSGHLQLHIAHKIMEINGRAINNLLVKLNNLLNEIEYIINIKNKFIKLIKLLKIKNIKPSSLRSNGTGLEGSLIEQTSPSKAQLTSPYGQIGKVGQDSHLPVQQTNLYTQITKGTGFTENKIKIEKTIKLQMPETVGNDQQVLINNSSDIQWINYFKSLLVSINVKSSPVDILYFNNNLNRPIINQYLKSMSIYNMITNGTMMYYSKFIGFNLFSQPTPYGATGGMQTNKLIKNIYKFLYSSFRSMYCLISKPVFIFKANKIIIQLFYFILIPKILKYKNKKEFYLNNNNKSKKMVTSQRTLHKRLRLG